MEYVKNFLFYSTNFEVVCLGTIVDCCLVVFFLGGSSFDGVISIIKRFINKTDQHFHTFYWY
jgi:hypothetical protein